MSAEEIAEIERLASVLRDPKPGPIAARLNRHPATISWYMLTHGLLTRPVRYMSRGYVRNGAEAHPWTPDQDRRLTELRVAGKNYREIGEILTVEFGVPRNAHKVQVRAVMLAATDDEIA